MAKPSDGGSVALVSPQLYTLSNLYLHIILSILSKKFGEDKISYILRLALHFKSLLNHVF